MSRLLRFVRSRRRAVIVAQDRPDPDGMASAAALKRLLIEKARLEQAVVATSGEVGRAENRATLQFLGEPLEDIASLDLESFDVRALVDTQPGFSNNSWPSEVAVHLVMDHHPRGPGIEPAMLADIRPDYGATSTMITEYLRAAGIPPGPQLATVLLYGIKTDTQDLSRGASEADTEAFLFLYPRANQRLLAKIERERLPRAYFATLARALVACRIYDSVAICPLGSIDSPDTVSEMADFFLRIEGVRWSLCYGLFDGRLYLSVRTTVRQGNAGHVARAIVDDVGQGGGHEMLAGGQIPLHDTRPEAIENLARNIELRFLRATEVRTRTPEPLVPDRLPEPAKPRPGPQEQGPPASSEQESS
ncbi:MAG: DHH family phosphoesterase [bacterium]